MAIKSNIVIDQGSDYEVTVNVKDANNVPVVLTGYTGAAQMRKHYTSLTSYSFGVTITALTGEVTLSMSSNTSNLISPGRYVYDCELTSTSNNTKLRIVEGIVTVTPQVTR
jgi:hypothetical protein